MKKLIVSFDAPTIVSVERSISVSHRSIIMEKCILFVICLMMADIILLVVVLTILVTECCH